jgi:hypothetical protein
MHYFGVTKLRKWFRTKFIHSTQLDDVWLSFGALENLWEVKRCKTFVSGMFALPWCTEVEEMVSH